MPDHRDLHTSVDKREVHSDRADRRLLAPGCSAHVTQRDPVSGAASGQAESARAGCRSVNWLVAPIALFGTAPTQDDLGVSHNDRQIVRGQRAVPAGSRVRKRSGCACARSSAAKVGKRPCLTVCSAAVVSFALLWSTAQGPRCLYALLTPIDLAQPVMLPGNRECEPERESDSLLIESRHRPP